MNWPRLSLHLRVGLLGLVCLVLGGEACAAASDGTSWPTVNLGYAADRYSPLDSLNTQNVGQLNEACRVRVDSGGAFQSGLLLVDGVIFLTTRAATVAMDPTDCSVLWKSVYFPEQKEPLPVVRGPAYAEGRIFRGTTDCRLLSLDARNGTVLWKIKACDPDSGESLSAAPIVWQGLLYIGIAGGDFGVRGRVFAFDAATGREVWRFNTIPAPGEFGADTWKGQSSQTGGGGTWSTYTLDTQAGNLFVPVGNPGADFDRSPRPGKDLFTNSLVVLDARSGRLKWWYQINAHDDKDLDLGAAPALLTLRDGRSAVAMGSKDGYLYVLDRNTHRLLFKVAVTTILNQDKPVTLVPMRTCPSVVGGVEWNGPAVDKLNRAIVVGAVDWCADVKKNPSPQYMRGEMFMGGSFTLVSDPAPSGWVTSVDQESGRVRWRYHAQAPVVSGITATAGGLVFFGDMSGNFYALSSADGTVLLRLETGGAIAGGVITYRVGEQQYVAVTSGNVSRLVWGETGLPSVVIYSLNARAAATHASASASDAPLEMGATDVIHGAQVYARTCSSCHGPAGEGVTGPVIQGIARRLSLAEIAAWIMNPVARKDAANGAIMPRLFPSTLAPQDVFDTAAYVGSL